MKSRIWLGLLLALFTGHAWGDSPVYSTPNTPAPMVLNGACTTPPCKVVANGSSHLFYSTDPNANSTLTQLLNVINAGITVNLGTLNGVSTAGNQATANGYLLTLATAQGAQGTGSTFNPPSGGSGILGYLSGIYKAITGTLTVSGTVTAQSPATSTAITPSAPAGAVLTLTAGGNSQNLANANACPNFIYIQNGQSTADQGGIAAVEAIYVNLTGNAASATPGGQSFAIYPGTTPIFVAQTTSIKWVAATTGHAINAWCE